MTNTTTPAESMVAPSGAASFYRWEVAGKPIAILFSLELMDRMEREVLESFKAVTKRGSEIGGVLGGRIIGGSQPTVIVEQFEAVECDYSRGPLYLLSDEDKVRMRQALDRVGSASSVAGFFRSNTRRELVLDEEDQAVAKEFFADPSQVFLLVRPFAMKPSAGGFFFWENGQLPEASYLQFPFKRSELVKNFAQFIVAPPEPPVVREPLVMPKREERPAAPPVALKREEPKPAAVAPPTRREDPAPPSPPPAAQRREEQRREASAPPPPVFKREEPKREAPAPPPVFKREEPKREAPAPPAPVFKREEPKREAPAPPPVFKREERPAPPVIMKREERQPIVPPMSKREERQSGPTLVSRREEQQPAPPAAAAPPITGKREERQPPPPVTPRREERTPVARREEKPAPPPVVAKREEPAPPKPEERPVVKPAEAVVVAPPKKEEPVKVEQVKVEQVKVEPVKVEQVKVEQVKVEPPKAEPAKAAPPRVQPVVAAAPPRVQPVVAAAPPRVQPAAAAAPVERIAPAAVEASGPGLFTRLKWVIVLLVVLALGGGYYFFVRQNGPAPAAKVADTSLGLKVENSAGQLLLSWSRTAPLVAAATRATLTINDGDHKEDVDLDLTTLRTGSIVYSPISNDVMFRLEVFDQKSGKSQADQVRRLTGRPSPSVVASNNQPAPIEVAKPQTNQKPTTPVQPAPQVPVSQPPAPQVVAEKAVTVKPVVPGSLADRLRPAAPAEIPAAPALDSQNNTLAETAANVPTGSAIAAPPPSAPARQTPAPAVVTPPRSNPAPAPVQAPAQATRQGGQAQEARVLKSFPAVYPAIAKTSHITGIVRVHAVIGKNGKVRKATAQSGPQVLRPAAAESVMRWIYSPAILNGETVETETDVDVRFQM